MKARHDPRPATPVTAEPTLPPVVASALEARSDARILVVIEDGRTVCHASGCTPSEPSLLDTDHEIRALLVNYRTVKLDSHDGAAFVDARLERHGELLRLGPKQVIAGQPPLPGAFVLDEHGDVADWVSLKGFDAQDNLRRLLASR
ncbi:MAG: hypothetical protein IPH13_09900 [Planctomycetes bacterium]|nr:hypothetical protein [Planctomycetota bacterium]MCC7171356.1 hypothetical protein [Planctomycetota bacterium]